MNLCLFAISLRGRKAYKDEAGLIHIECTSCHSIKPEYSFQTQTTGF